MLKVDFLLSGGERAPAKCKREIFETFATLRKNGAAFFADLSYQEDILLQSQKIGKTIRENFKHYLVLGIGGSALGARFLLDALAYYKKSTCQVHIVDFLDPPALKHLIKDLDPAETAVHIMSKSGNTVEVVALSLFFRQWLTEALGEKEAGRHLLATLGEGESAILTLCRRWEVLQVLPIQDNLGGRYSVLSQVGLIPACVAGIDIQGLYAGAQVVDRGHFEMAFENACFYESEFQKNRNIHVVMSYSEYLREFGSWLSQLWAESLGKRGRGMTPLSARGVSDQHSLLQLFLDGPDDKCFTFLSFVGGERLNIPSLPDDEAFDKVRILSGVDFGALMQTELRATQESLAARGRSVVTWELPELSAQSIGALIHYAELLTVFAALLSGVNPFDQPAVEECKTRITAGLRALRL